MEEEEEEEERLMMVLILWMLMLSPALQEGDREGGTDWAEEEEEVEVEVEVEGAEGEEERQPVATGISPPPCLPQRSTRTVRTCLATAVWTWADTVDKRRTGLVLITLCSHS